MADEMKDEKSNGNGGNGSAEQKVKPPTPVPAPGPEPIHILKFNHRYGAINAGEQAGFPKSEAEKLCEMTVNRPGQGEVKVAELVKVAKRDPKTGGIL
jgi:hypothetical protein